MKEMTEKEALQILDEVSSKVSGDRKLHALILQALDVLKKLVEEKDARSKA